MYINNRAHLLKRRRREGSIHDALNARISVRETRAPKGSLEVCPSEKNIKYPECEITSGDCFQSTRTRKLLTKNTKIIKLHCATRYY